jgi:lysozyme
VKISDAGLQLIQEFEGLRLDAYPDPGTGGEPWTIGWGTTVYPGGRRVQQGDRITEAQAMEYLRNDVERFESSVSAMLRVPVTQPQFDALVSLAYNVRANALRDSTLIELLNAGDSAGAAAQFDRWIHAGGRPMEGLRRRRRAERAMFESEQLPAPIEARTTPPRPSDAPTPQPTTAEPPAARLERPMPPIALLGPLIGLLTSVAPDLVRIFTDKARPVSERNTEAAITVLDLAKRVSQASTPAAAVEAIVADPVMQQQFREAVQASWYELSPGDGGGVTGARQAAQSARDAPGAAGWIAAVNQLAMDAAVVGGGGWIMWSLATAAGTPPEVKTLIIGSVAGYVAAVIQFRYGSSVGSRAKDAALAQRAAGQR